MATGGVACLDPTNLMIDVEFLYPKGGRDERELQPA